MDEDTDLSFFVVLQSDIPGNGFLYRITVYPFVIHLLVAFTFHQYAFVTTQGNLQHIRFLFSIDPALAGIRSVVIDSNQ